MYGRRDVPGSAGAAVKLAGRSPDARFSFINDVYEPLQVQHNKRPAFVARGVAPRYLFHTGKDRWVISKVLDDGYACWAFAKAGDSQIPSDAKSPWTVCDNDGEWRPDPSIQCSAIPASTDKFVQLRLTLDADMKQYGLVETSDLKKLWRRLDFNNNGVVSLAEIDKMVTEMVAGGVWPAWLNNKPALMRAYKKTVLKDSPGDEFVQKDEFHALLLNIFWFNKLWMIFVAIDAGADRRIDVREFTAGMAQLGLNLSPQEAQTEFRKMDVNGGGQVLFVEMCAYIRKRVNPDDNAEFDADIVSGEKCDTASYNKVKGQQGARDINTGKRATHSDHFRARGDTATLTHTVKQKALADFDALEDKIKALCQDPQKIKDTWSRIDFNGNGILSLAEIDKWVCENYELLNHKPALMRCYKCTIESGDYHDDFVHRKDFKRLIVNLFYFNKLYWIFDEVNGEDRRMSLQEFKMCYALGGMQASEQQATADFRMMDKNGGGQVLFDEFCHFFASKACPQGMTDLIDDGVDRMKYDGTGDVLAAASGHAHWKYGKLPS